MKRLAALLLIVVTSFTMCVCGVAGETTATKSVTLNINNRRNELLAEGSRSLSRYTEHTVAINSVRGYLIFKHGIMKTKSLDRI